MLQQNGKQIDYSTEMLEFCYLNYSIFWLQKFLTSLNCFGVSSSWITYWSQRSLFLSGDCSLLEYFYWEVFEEMYELLRLIRFRSLLVVAATWFYFYRLSLELYLLWNPSRSDLILMLLDWSLMEQFVSLWKSKFLRMLLGGLSSVLWIAESSRSKFSDSSMPSRLANLSVY